MIINSRMRHDEISKVKEMRNLDTILRHSRDETSIPWNPVFRFIKEFPCNGSSHLGLRLTFETPERFWSGTYDGG